MKHNAYAKWFCPDSFAVCIGNSSKAWSIEKHNPYKHYAVRKLINESLAIFCELQNTVDKLQRNSSEFRMSSEELLSFSSRYRGIIRNCSLDLQKTFEQDASSSSEEVADLRSLYDSLELIWSLCEVLFIDCGASAAYELVMWSTWHFTRADMWLKELLDGLHAYPKPEAHEKYWDTILLFVLMGRTDEARKLLALHSRKLDAAFSSIDELLRKIPLNQGPLASSDPVLWSCWQQQAFRRLKEGHFVMFSQLELIARVLAGDESVFVKVRSLFSSWYEMLVSRALYLYPTAKVTDLQNFIPECKKAFSVQGNLDDILCAVFEFDVLKVLKDLSTNYDNWWAASHLADLLLHCGCVDIGEIRFSVDLREYLVLEYASSLMEHQSLWEVGCLYFDHCPLLGKEYLKLYLEHFPLDNDRKVLKIISQCNRRGFTDIARGICRQMSVSALKRGCLSTAMSWCMQAKDPSLSTFVVEQYLMEYGNSGLLHSMHLLDNLGSALLSNPSLAFLAKYREFHRLRETGDSKAAGDVLFSLLMSKIAPKKFWHVLLLDCLSLLEATAPLIFNDQQIYKLMELVEDIATEIELFNSVAYLKPDENSDHFLASLQQFRESLVKNLSKAIMKT